LPTRPLTAHQKQEAVDAVAQYGSQLAAADALGLSRGALENRYRQGVKAGLDQAIVHPAPQGHVVKGVSTLYDAGGNVAMQWVKTRNDAASIEETVEAILGAIGDRIDPAEPVPAPETTDTDLVTVYPLADWHIGLLAWRRETDEDWDLGIARSIISKAMRRLVASSPSSEQAVVLGLGDLLHADNYQNRTARSGHLLDVDGRYPKTLRTATELVIETIDMALQKHALVLVRLIPGNHDDQSAIAVSLALSLFYAGNPRVTVDDNPGRYWWWRWGSVFLGAAHGDMAKMAELPLVMASSRPDDWGLSKHRLIFTGHVHHRSVLSAAKEYGGVNVESFNTPAAKDAWQTAAGYRSGRSVHSLTFHKTDGEIGRVRANIVTS
jgi:hypothetical protein